MSSPSDPFDLPLIGVIDFRPHKQTGYVFDRESVAESFIQKRSAATLDRGVFYFFVSEEDAKKVI
jgi:hypothetical protein